jgi:hypothetical protein
MDIETIDYTEIKSNQSNSKIKINFSKQQINATFCAE